MAERRRKIAPALQEANDAFGRAFLRWRLSNGLSQQDPHSWGQATGIPLHNSQIAYLERGELDPKATFWLSLEAFNKDINNGGVPDA